MGRTAFRWTLNPLLACGLALGTRQALAETPPQAPATTQETPEQMQREFEAALAPSQPDATAAQPPATGAASSGSTLRLLDLSLDVLGAAGTATASEDDIGRLQAGGHDPKLRGFTLQNAELALAGIVDPYLRADANIALQLDDSGETNVELEEAYLTTLDLPYQLQMRAGHFLTAFGRLNPTHPHAWDFVDQPVVLSRLFGGDGLRAPGLELSWLCPLPFFVEVVASAQNSHGQNAVSFRSRAGEVLAGRTLIERKVHRVDDLLYMLRVRASFDASDEWTILVGASSLFGPNATSDRARTEIYGADLYVKWKPLLNDQGWPFLAWQSEALLRHYEAAAVFDAAAQVASARALDDAGFYSQLVWGLTRPWTLGVRVDYARSQRQDFSLSSSAYSTDADPLRGPRTRYALNATFYPSEFSKVRLQYNLDRARFPGARTVHGIYAQFEVLLGAHQPHKF